jgi:hypothetical protein
LDGLVWPAHLFFVVDEFAIVDLFKVRKSGKTNEDVAQTCSRVPGGINLKSHIRN